MIDIFKEDYIFLNEHFSTQEEVFTFIASKAISLGFGDDEQEVFNALKKREKEASTGLQDGLAIPHAISAFLHKPAVLFIRSSTEISGWNTLDESKVTQIIAMLVPKDSEDEHLQILSKFASALIDEDEREALAESETVDEVLEILIN